MKRKLWIILALAALIAALCISAALADGHSFTRQPVGGTVVPDGGRLISWTTNFTPTKVVLGYSYSYDYGFLGGSGWSFSPQKTVETGLQPDMQTTLVYSSAVTSERWTVRAYYNDTEYEESSEFSIDVVSRQFTVSPTGGTLDPIGSLALSWETNFRPTRVSIGYETMTTTTCFFQTTTTTVYHEAASLTAGLKKSMRYSLPYDDAAESDSWIVRAYYDDERSVDSKTFTVETIGRTFATQPTDGSVAAQSKYYASWALNFQPVRQELVHKWTTSVTDWFNQVTYYDHEEVIAEVSTGVRQYPCPGYEGLVIRAYYSDDKYVDSQKFNVTEAGGTFLQQPQGGITSGGGTYTSAWETDFTPSRIEFIQLGANNEQTVLETWEGDQAAIRSGSYPFPSAQGDYVNAKYRLRATYLNGAKQEKAVLSDPFYVGSAAADYRFTTQPEDCYSVSINWSSVTWAVNFLPEKVEYLRGTGTDVSQYSVTDWLSYSDTYNYVIRCYYSVADDLYCTSDPFTVTYYQDVWTKQPEGGVYVMGTRFHLTWELKFRPETIILRYCTPEGHPITLVEQFPLDPDRNWYDMEIESGNPSQYYYIWAWLDDVHYVVSDPFQVRKVEDYIFVQQAEDMTVPDSGAENLTWITGFRPERTEVFEFAVGDPDQVINVTELDDPAQNTFEVTADGTNRERAFVVRAWYSETEYVDSRLAIATQELIERVFTVQPENGSIPVNGSFTLRWMTNFTPVKTEVWRGSYADGAAADLSLYQTLDNPRAASWQLENDSPGTMFEYEVRAYYSDTHYISSRAAAIYHERNYLFIRQPRIGEASSDGTKLSVSWKVDFTPVRTEVIQNGEVIETLDAGVMAHEFAESDAEYFVRVYYDEIGFIDSDPFRIDIVTITFLLGHGSSQGPYYEYVSRGSSYILPKCMFGSPSDSGWMGHFVEWAVGPSQTRKAVGDVIQVIQDTDVKAIWETGYYTITFHPPMAGGYPEECQQDIDPETGLLTYRWAYMYYATSDDEQIIRPKIGQLPNWTGYGPAPVHLYWDLTKTLDENYKEPVWPAGSSNHGYTAYDRSVPVVYGFRPFSNLTVRGYVTHVDAYPVFGWRGLASYDANGGTGYMQSDSISVPMGENVTYTVRQNSYTAPSRSKGNAPSYYDFDNWMLNGEPCAPGTVMTASGSDLPFVARWKDRYNNPGFYLYGIFNGEAYGCSEDAGALGDLFQETGENTWTARVSSGEGCHVSVKYYNGYYNESLWYHAEPSGEMASLTLAQATEDPADMLELPAGTWILTLEGNEAGGYTLRYEETDPLCSVNGDITNWDTVEMALNSEGVYTYSTRIEPYMSWSGTFEFYFTLNGADYSANAMIFDKIEGLALAPMDSEEDWNNIRLASSGAATYTFTIDPADMTLTVTNDLETSGAFLMGFMGDYPIQMRDPSSGEAGMGEGGYSEPPVDPYSFPGGTTLWASVSVSGGEWLTEGPTFYIGCSGQTWGTSSVTLNTPMTLQLSGRCPIWVEEDADSVEFDFYYCPETHQLMIKKHIGSHRLILYTWNAAEERPMSEVTDYYEGDIAAFTISPASAVHYRDDWEDALFVLDGDTLTITAPDYPGYHVAAWYPCSVSMWWSSGRTGFDLNLYGEEPSLGSGSTLTYPIEEKYGEICLTAVYEAGETELVSITFDAMGGVPEPEAQSLVRGQKAIEPGDPVKIGSVFTGWYTDAECTAESRYSFDTPVTENMTLYAGWMNPETAGILKLPAGLTELEDEAFAGIAAEAVVIPNSVTAISGDPFAGSQVRYIYGYAGSEAQAFTENHPAYTFVPIDDAWQASH